MSELRAGLGFDVHRTRRIRELWLGGVRFEGEPGLAGHSDGDAVCHAIADALLGAAALGDVGQHFPDTDPAVEGIGGLELLGRVVALIADAGLAPGSCDVTVLCERPAIAPRRDEMRAALAQRLATFRWNACRSRRPARRAWGSPATASDASPSRCCDDGSRRPSEGGARSSRPSAPDARRDVLVAPGVRETQGSARGRGRGRRGRGRHARGGPHASSTASRATTRASSRDCATTPARASSGSADLGTFPFDRRRVRRRPRRHHGSAELRRRARAPPRRRAPPCSSRAPAARPT